MPSLNRPSRAFDPEAICILDSALDGAWQTLESKVKSEPEAVRSALARHIVDVAAAGERDRQRLIEGALARLKI